MVVASSNWGKLWQWTWQWLARWRDALARGIENKFSIFFTWPDSGRINCLRRPWRVSFGCTAIKGFKENLATLYSTVFPINSQVLQGSWILLLFLWICKTFFLWLNASRHRVDIWYMKRDIELKFCVINFGEKKLKYLIIEQLPLKGVFKMFSTKVLRVLSKQLFSYDWGLHRAATRMPTTMRVFRALVSIQLGSPNACIR